jgi:hypothetical protein
MQVEMLLVVVRREVVLWKDPREDERALLRLVGMDK